MKTCFASLDLLYSFWMSTLVSTTAARGETCRSKNQIPAESCTLWMESLGRCRAQLDSPVSATSSGCVHSVALLSSWRSIASS